MLPITVRFPGMLGRDSGEYKEVSASGLLLLSMVIVPFSIYVRHPALGITQTVPLYNTATRQIPKKRITKQIRGRSTRYKLILCLC